MVIDLVIPLAAILISAAAFVFTRLDHRHTARRDWVDQLQDRIAECERHREKLEAEVKRLRGVELDLLRRVFDLERRQP